MSPTELSDLLTPDELRAHLKNTVSLKTLANWRNLGIGPPFIKSGRTALYPMKAVLTWQETRIHQPRRGP